MKEPFSDPKYPGYTMADGSIAPSRPISWREFHEEKCQLLKQMHSIQENINAHALGVQRVYDEVVEIKKLFDLSHVKELIALLHSIDKKTVDQQMAKINMIVNSSVAVNVSNDFKRLHNGLRGLLESIDDHGY